MEKSLNEIFLAISKIIFWRHTDTRTAHREETKKHRTNSTTNEERVYLFRIRESVLTGSLEQATSKRVEKGSHPRRIETRKKSLAFMLFSTFSLFCTPC